LYTHLAGGESKSHHKHRPCILLYMYFQVMRAYPKHSEQGGLCIAQILVLVPCR
jgi:hypothetical protein